MLAKVKKDPAYIQATILDNFLQEKNIGSPKEIIEKKNVKGQKGDEITTIAV